VARSSHRPPRAFYFFDEDTHPAGASGSLCGGESNFLDSLRTEDAFPVVASLPFSGNASAVRRLLPGQCWTVNFLTSVSMSVSCVTCVGSSWWTRRVDRTKQRFDTRKRRFQSNILSSIWLQRYTSLHTFTIPSSSIRFHFPRAKAMWSRFSNERMETSLPHLSARVPVNGEQQREIQLLIHSFIRKENTPFWREDHLRILEHLCGWLKLKKKPEFSKDKQEFNHRRAMHVKKKFWRENTM